MSKESVPPLTFTGLRRRPLAVVGSIVGVGLAAAYTLKPELFDVEITWNARKKQAQQKEVSDVKKELHQMLLEQLNNQDKKVMQLETQLRLLRDDLREQKNKQQQVARAQIAATQPVSRPFGDVFELSEIIQANNLANSARYTRELEDQRQKLIREHLLSVEGEILKVENKYRPIINKIHELESHLESQRKVQQKEAPARLLWLSCQSLLDKMRHSPQEPLEKDPAYDVLKKFAANDNPLAVSIIDAIPAKALQEGVPSEETLAQRFSKLEKICKRVAMIDANGGGLARYLLSYLQSLFILDNVKVSEDEVSGRQLVDPTTWGTFDILARVRYCLDCHNLEQAVRYANQLRGQARVVARDWIRDARIHLITRQAFNTLSTHAEAIAIDSNVMFNQTDSQK